MFLKHLILASIFSLSCPSRACNSSTDKELKSVAGIGGGGGNTIKGQKNTIKDKLLKKKTLEKLNYKNIS